MRPRLLPVLSLLTLASASCGSEPEAVLRVGDLGIAQAEVGGLTEAERADLADAAGLGLALARDEVDELLEPILERERIHETWLALPLHLGAARLGLGEGELREAYARSPEWELEVRHVVRLVPRGTPQRERTRQREVAEEVARRAASGEDFAALAGEYSEEPGAARRGGALEPGREGSWVAPFWEAALPLQPGETSGVVESEFGFHVIRLDERRPVPFEEADRVRLLRERVPQPVAGAAMESWLETAPATLLDPPAVARAREALARGRTPDAIPVLSGGDGTGELSGTAVAAAWASLSPDQRAAYAGADEAGFSNWIGLEAQTRGWAAAARELGVSAPPRVEADARLRWRSRVAGWGLALGFLPDQPEREVRERALRAATGTTQDVRAARAEVSALRPLLRERYPARDAAD